jgi:hypothetical protein
LIRDDSGHFALNGEDAPLAHAWEVEHALLHMPQLPAFVSRSTQPAGKHRVWPGVQTVDAACAARGAASVIDDRQRCQRHAQLA